MRILLTVHHDLDPDSGAPGTTLRLAEEYRRAGHDVEVLGLGELLLHRLPEQARMVAFPWAVAARLARAQSAFDVIDASTGDAWLLGTLRRALRPGVRGALLVTRSHGLEHAMVERRHAEAAEGGEPLSWKYPIYHGGWRLWEVARSLRVADVALFLNRADRDFAVSRLGVAPERAVVVHNGISERLVGLPPPTPAPEGSGRIAVIGSYLPMKGIAYAATALNAWLPDRPGWQVTFLGTGVGRDAVLADYDVSLHDRISIVPRYRNDDLPHLLAGHHVQLFATLAEGWGIALLEGMACGLTAVSTSMPGPTSFFVDGEHGVLIPPADAAAIVAALDRVTADAAALQRLRQNAHRAAQSYGWSQVASEQLELYGERLQRRRREEVLR